MDDEWERKHGLDDSMDDSQSDPDGDGLTCLEEFERFTHPMDADTDDDGLGDAVETNRGVFSSLTDRGTSPLVADTDGDGLGDAAEDPTQAFVPGSISGTDPNLADSDRDLISDGDELDASTDSDLCGFRCRRDLRSLGDRASYRSQ